MCVYVCAKLELVDKFCYLGDLLSRDGWIMREKFANYAQRFYRLCAHFLPIMRKLCALFANYAQIMRNDFKDYARTLPIMRTFHVKS